MEEKKEHDEKKVEHHSKQKKSNFWMYISLVLVILLAVSAYFNFLGSSGDLSKEEAGDKILTFINQKMMQDGVEAELKSIEEVGGVYRLKLDVEGQEFELYSSKNAEAFFPQGFVIKELEAELDALGSETEATGAVTTEITKSDKPNVKMFVMSFCPYGQQAENGLGPALKALGNTVEFEPHFVIYSNYATNRGGSWEDFCWDEEQQYCSMHGVGELNEGVRQLCVFSETPDKWWSYVDAINKKCTYQDVDTCWEGVAKEVGLDTAAIKKCFDEKGELLLKKELLFNKQYGVQGSPTILINEGTYNGGRAPENYKQGICDAFNEAPSVCGETLSTTGATASGSC